MRTSKTTGVVFRQPSRGAWKAGQPMGDALRGALVDADAPGITLKEAICDAL